MNFGVLLAQESEPILSIPIPLILSSVFFLSIGLLCLMGRMHAGYLDHARIRDYFSRYRCQVISIRWTPFGHGWFGERTNRIYRVEYRDQSGYHHEVTAKTSMLAGVYLTEDEVVGNPPSNAHTSQTQANPWLEQKPAQDNSNSWIVGLVLAFVALPIGIFMAFIGGIILLVFIVAAS